MGDAARFDWRKAAEVWGHSPRFGDIRRLPECATRFAPSVRGPKVTPKVLKCLR